MAGRSVTHRLYRAGYRHQSEPSGDKVLPGCTPLPYSKPSSVQSVLILLSHRLIDKPGYFLARGFLTKNVYAFVCAQYVCA
jgi:hypothetical protein